MSEMIIAIRKDIANMLGKGTGFTVTDQGYDFTSNVADLVVEMGDGKRYEIHIRELEQ